MNKRFFLMFCAVLLCLAHLSCALAASNSLDLTINGQAMSLEFDPSTKFSNVSGDTVQASFFGYPAGSDVLYEFYLMFPTDVRSGTTLTPDSTVSEGRECSVVAIVTSKTAASYYFAGYADGVDASQASDFTLSFDSVTDSGDLRSFSGTLTADMVSMTPSDDPAAPKTLQLTGGTFRFSMSMSATAPEETPEPSSPGQETNPFEQIEPEQTPGAPSPTREVLRA